MLYGTVLLVTVACRPGIAVVFCCVMNDHDMSGGDHGGASAGDEERGCASLPSGMCASSVDHLSRSRRAKKVLKLPRCHSLHVVVRNRQTVTRG